MTDYNITKRIRQKSSRRSFIVLRPLIQFKSKIWLNAQCGPYLVCCQALFTFSGVWWGLASSQYWYRNLVLTPPIKFCNISIPRWHVPFIKIKPGYESYTRFTRGARKYFLQRNIWDVNTRKYLTYLLYEIQFHVIWVTSLSPPNNSNVGEYFGSKIFQ